MRISLYHEADDRQRFGILLKNELDVKEPDPFLSILFDLDLL